MITPNVTMKLEGKYYEAFRSFALRSEATTTTENIKRIIETLPEFKSFSGIPDVNPPSVKTDITKSAESSQGKKPPNLPGKIPDDEAA